MSQYCCVNSKKEKKSQKIERRIPFENGVENKARYQNKTLTPKQLSYKNLIEIESGSN